MKKQIPFNDDFEQLADTGWAQLANQLDKELPVSAHPINYSKLILQSTAAIALLMGLFFGLKATQNNTPNSRAVQPLPTIVNHFSFDVKPPEIVMNINFADKRPANQKEITNPEVDLALATPTTTDNNPIGLKRPFAKPNVLNAVANRTHSFVQLLQATHTNTLTAPIPDLPIANSTELAMLSIAKPHTKLGFNLNYATQGILNGSSVGGGVSIVVPLGSGFSVESGVGYDLARLRDRSMVQDGSQPAASFNSVSMPAPRLDVKYRVRQSIELPLSLHYQPLRHFALTGGVNLGLLVSQRMVFDKTASYGMNPSYIRQLNEGELNQLNRLKLGAHGGVAWLPSDSWKLGLYYGQNLTNDKKSDSNKLKFSNHIFKVRMSRYF